MIQQKVPKGVTPAKAGVQKVLKYLDSGFRRNDGKAYSLPFYGSIRIDALFSF